MKKTNRFITGLSALAIVVSAGFTASPAFAAAPNTCLWTGATDTLFSTATNWSNCGGVAPQAGDIIAFDNTAANNTLTNDLGVAFGGVQLMGGGSTSKFYTVNTLTLAPSAAIVDTSASAFTALSISGTLTGQGDLALASNTGNFAFYGGIWTVAGTVATSNVQPSFGNLTGGLFNLSNSVATADFTGTATNGATVNSSENFAITSTTPGFLNFDNSTSGGTQSYALSGTVTLNSNEYVCPASGVTVTFTGALTANGHSITKDTSASCTGTVNFNWSNAASLAGSTSPKTSAPKAPNTGKVSLSQASAVAPVLGAVLVAAGILSVRYIATRKR